MAPLANKIFVTAKYLQSAGGRSPHAGKWKWTVATSQETACAVGWLRCGSGSTLFQLHRENFQGTSEILSYEGCVLAANGKTPPPPTQRATTTCLSPSTPCPPPMQLHVRVMEATLTRGPGGLRVDTLHLGGRGEPPGSPARAPGRPYGGNRQRQSCG
jgi:hypothetical protein